MFMKKIEIEQMECIEGGFKYNRGCISNVASGMSLLWSAVFVIGAATNPIGWTILGLSAIGYVAADHTACDD